LETVVLKFEEKVQDDYENPGGFRSGPISSSFVDGCSVKDVHGIG